MKEADVQRLWHIKEYCEDIMAATRRFGADYAVFAADKDYYNSVAMCLMQIGELSGKLSDEFKDAMRNRVTWGPIKSMRNMFAHDYVSIDKPTVWDTATRDIPAMLDFCHDIIEQNPEDFELFDPLYDDEPDEDEFQGMTMP